MSNGHVANRDDDGEERADEELECRDGPWPVLIADLLH